ncbi:MAG: hypothetical protein AAGD43_03280 [Pseudomonadota bacterium]
MNVTTGEIVAAPQGGGDDPGFDLGNSLDANALEHLVATGRMTPQQAAIYAASQRFAGPDGTVHTFSPYGGDTVPGGGQGSPGGSNPSPGTTVGSVNTLLPATPPKPTEAQEKASLFALPMLEAVEALETLETSENPQFGNERAAIVQDAAPLGTARWLQSPEYQQYDAHKRSFINASLRRESGAAIRDEEYLAAEKRLFPMPGDSQPVIEQKRNLRRSMAEEMRRQALPATRYHDYVTAKDGNGPNATNGDGEWETITLPGGETVEVQEVN